MIAVTPGIKNVSLEEWSSTEVTLIVFPITQVLDKKQEPLGFKNLLIRQIACF